MIYLATCIKSRYPLFYASIMEVANQWELNLYFVESKNPWIRDFYPVKIREHLVKFNYAPFYHKQEIYREPEPPVKLAFNKNKVVTNVAFKIDGGAIISDSSKSILFISEKFYSTELREFLISMGIKSKLIYCDPDDFTGHLDGLYRIIDNVVLYSEYLDVLSPIWHKKNKQFFKTLKYTLITIPDGGIYHESDYFKGTYLNFLIHKNYILLPKSKPSGLKRDHILATEKKVESIFGREFNLKAIWVNCDEPMNDGGAIHCLTWDD